MSIRIVLASGSPRRLDVLRQLGLEPCVKEADVDERYLPGESPHGHVERLAREKAETVARDLGAQASLVIGGDTLVLDGDRVLGKPENESEALAMLLSLAGRTHRVLSALALVGPRGTVSAFDSTRVRLRAFSETEARRYVATGEPLDKAGSYGIQGLGAALVEGLDGDYYSVVGFPVGVFIDLLGRAGWRYEFGDLRPIE